MDLTERKLKSATLYEGKILKLTVDEVVLPDGKRAQRECVRHHGGAAVLFVENGKVLLVRQFRYLYGKSIYEIPAGKVEDGEDPAVCAAREIEEETGYKPENVEKFLTLYPTPGYTDEVINVYLVQKCIYTHTDPDDGEFINSEFMPIEKVLSMIESGEICDAKTVCAIYKYLSLKK